jgi:hypothetical protein
MTDDPLAKWRRPGDVLVKEPDATATADGSIKRGTYKAFAEDTARVPLLVLKSGLVKLPKTDKAFPYACISKVISDGYGFFFSLVFNLASGKVVVEFTGEGMGPLLDAIGRGTVTKVQIFDPDRFLPPAPGAFNAEADEWRGATVVHDINITDRFSPGENTTRH